MTRSNSPIGWFRIASTEAGLAYVELPHSSGRGMRDWMQRYVPEHRCVDEVGPNKAAIEQILEYLASERTHFDMPLDLRGTPFQRAVWDVLLKIPYGETCSYVEVARAIGRPNPFPSWCRATGSSPPTGASGATGEARISRPACSRWNACGRRAIGCSKGLLIFALRTGVPRNRTRNPLPHPQSVPAPAIRTRTCTHTRTRTKWATSDLLSSRPSARSTWRGAPNRRDQSGPLFCTDCFDVLQPDPCPCQSRDTRGTGSFAGSNRRRVRAGAARAERPTRSRGPTRN